MINDTINCVFNFVLHLGRRFNWDGAGVRITSKHRQCFVNGIVETRSRGRQVAQNPQCNIIFLLKKLSIAGVRNLIHPNGKLRDVDYPNLNEDLWNNHVRRWGNFRELQGNSWGVISRSRKALRLRWNTLVTSAWNHSCNK